MALATSYVAGYILAVMSMLMTAIFPVFGKIKRVKSTQVNPMIFNIYFLCGVIIFCVMAAVTVTLAGHLGVSFSYMGLISGLMLGVGGWFIWLALTYMGIAHVSALSSGTATITGFLEGLASGDYPENTTLCAVSLFLIVLGIFCIGFNEVVTATLSRLICCVQDAVSVPHPPELDIEPVHYNKPSLVFRFSSSQNTSPLLSRKTSNRSNRTNSSRHSDLLSIQEDEEAAPLQQESISEQLEGDSEDDAESLDEMERDRIDNKLRMTGFAFSIIGGVCFGSMSFPEEFAEITEVYYMPSFGVGVSIMVILNLIVLSVRLNDNQPWHFGACFLPAMASGIIWSLIGYSDAIPIRECSISIAVLIGIFGFKEVKDIRAIVVTLASVGITLTGAFLLACSGGI